MSEITASEDRKMNESQEVLNYIDSLVFKQTGKHLDNLQFSILKGVLNGKKYSKIAEEYNCGKGHLRDKACQLWHILSDSLGEEVNRANFYATIERLNSNNHINIGHTFNVDNNINFCPNTSKEKTDIIDDNLESENQIISSNHENNGYQIIIEQAQKKVKLETIPKLVKIGLTAEQIAESLELTLDEVEKIIRSEA
jgi:hypothetical protein